MRTGIWTWAEFSARFSDLLKLDEYESDAPQEIHLSMTADSTQMMVSWAQQTVRSLPSIVTCKHIIAELCSLVLSCLCFWLLFSTFLRCGVQWTPAPTVQYGLSPNALTQSAVGTSHNYSVEMLEGPWHSMQLNVVRFSLFACQLSSAQLSSALTD